MECVYPDAGVVCLPRFKTSLSVEYESLYRTLAEEYKTFVIPGRCWWLRRNLVPPPRLRIYDKSLVSGRITPEPKGVISSG